MKKIVVRGIIVVGMLISILEAHASSHTLSLKEAYSDRFMVGAALNAEQIHSENAKAMGVIREHFNTATAENEMKWEAIQPERGKYDFTAGDALVRLGEEYGMAIIGHTLVWHQQTPDWVFQDENGATISRAVLVERLRTHIYTVVGRYRGRIHGWDVVNEAFNEDGSWRKSPWYEIIGPEFIELAFRFAKESDPDVGLYYNDYNLFKPAKRDAVLRLVDDLREKGVVIDGVGIQGHYALDYPDMKQLEDSIVAFGEGGCEVMITELDVSVLPFPEEEGMGADVSLNFELKKEFDPYSKKLPGKVNRAQADQYETLFRLFLKHSDVVSRVTFWGVGDSDSWRNDWPMSGRTDYPLPFDRDYLPKLTVERIVALVDETSESL